MCKFVCLLGFAGALFRKVTRASVVICVCVYWRGTASWLGRALALRLRPEVDALFERKDKNHDNKLSRKEFSDFMNDRGKK